MISLGGSLHPFGVLRFAGKKKKTPPPLQRSTENVPPAVMKLFKAVPKTELHMHLPGSTPIGLIQSFLRKIGWTEKAIQKETRLKDTYQSLNDFLKTYYRVTRHIHTPQQFRQSAQAVVKACARENVRYLEMRASILNKGGTPAEIVDAIEAGIRDGMAWVQEHKDWTMKTGLIILAQRAGSPEDSLETAKQAVTLAKRPGSLIRGFDLAGSETDHPPARHTEALRYAKQHGLKVTIHAGETEQSAGISGVKSIKQALNLGADRIGHGLQLRKNPALRQRVRDNGIHVELPPWANVQLQSVKDYPDHPLPEFLKQGLEVSLCTDNRMVMNITHTEQLGHLYHHGILTRWEDIKTLVLNGVRGAFVSPFEKKQLLQGFEKALQDIEKHPFYKRTIERYLTGAQQADVKKANGPTG